MLDGFHPGFELIVSPGGNVDAKLGTLVDMNAGASLLASSGRCQGGLPALLS